MLLLQLGQLYVVSFTRPYLAKRNKAIFFLCICNTALLFQRKSLIEPVKLSIVFRQVKRPNGK